VLGCQINKTEADYSYYEPHGQRPRQEGRVTRPKRRKSLSKLRLVDDDIIDQHSSFESTPNIQVHGTHEYSQPQRQHEQGDDSSVSAEYGTDLANRNQFAESRWDKVQHKFHRAGSTYAMIRARELLLGEDRIPPQNQRSSSGLSRSLSQPQPMRKKQVRFELSPQIVDDLASEVNYVQIDPDENTPAAAAAHIIETHNSFCNDRFDDHPHHPHAKTADREKRHKPRMDKLASESVKRATTEDWIMNHPRPLLNEYAQDCCGVEHSAKNATVYCQRYETEVAPSQLSTPGARTLRRPLPHPSSHLYTESFDQNRNGYSDST